MSEKETMDLTTLANVYAYWVRSQSERQFDRWMHNRIMETPEFRALKTGDERWAILHPQHPTVTK